MYVIYLKIVTCKQMQVLKVRQNLPITPRRPGDPECSSFPHFRKVVRIPKRLKKTKKQQHRTPVRPDVLSGLTRIQTVCKAISGRY